MATLSLNDDGLVIPKQDLDTVVPDSDDDGRLFQHNGNSTITLVGGDTANETGFYVWDHTASAWDPLENTITDADTLDGYDSLDFTLQTDFDDHTGDTANPHAVSVGQLDAYATADADSAFVDVAGDTLTGPLEFGNNPFTHGANGGGDLITETTSPKSFEYDGNASRDIQDVVTLTISNGTTASVTEDVTVELYEGVDTTGTLLRSETISVTVAAGSTGKESFLSKNEPLSDVTYHIEVVTSGTTLAVDQTDVDVHGASYTFDQDAYGIGVLRTQSGRNLLEFDPIANRVTAPYKFDVLGDVEFNLDQASSGSASAGYIPEADGNGNISWAAGGGFGGVTDSLSVTGWSVKDVSNEGFPGDQTGGDLAQFIADDTVAGGKHVYILPEGTYDWLRSVQFTGDSGGTYDEDRPHTIVLIGKPNATLHVDIGDSVDKLDRKCFQFGNSTTGIEKVGLHNLHIDVGDANEARDAGLMRCYIEDEGQFSDITMSRRHRCDSTDPTIKNGDRFSFKLDCINRDASATMKRVKLANGDVHVSDDDSVGHAIPFSSGDYHVGTNHWIDCYVYDFTDNGYYLRDGHGSNYLKGCTAKDCGAGNFRLGLNDKAENITSIAESPSFNCTPLWVEVKRESVDTDSNYVEGDEKSEAVVVDGFDIHTSSGAAVNDVIRVSSNLPEAVIKNGFVHSETDDFLVDASAHTGSIKIKNVQFDDYASGANRRAAINLRMDNATLDNCTYRPYPGADNGRSIVAVEGANIIIKDSDLKGTYLPAIEAYAGADYQVRGNLWGHDGSYTDPYFIRNNSTSVDAVWLKDNDLRAYATLIGTGDSTDYNYYVKKDNRGL